MPGGDRTGPAGMGPMTGRAAGYCAGYQGPGYMNPFGRLGFRGWGRGRGGGRGWRNWFYATGLTGWQRAGRGWPAFGWGPAPAVSATPYDSSAGAEQQLGALKAQAEYLEEALNNIRRRIGELEAKQPTD